MGSRTETFDEWCYKRNYPRRLNPVPPDLGGLLDEYRKRAEIEIQFLQANFIKGKTLDIYCNYFDSGELNAAADIYNFLGLIGVFKGAVLLPLDMFQRMLAHPFVLPQIGDASKESIASNFSEGLFTDIDELNKFRTDAGRPPYPTAPNDQIRQQFAVACSLIAFDFLILHELGHIALGQCEFIYGNGGTFAILEIAAKNTSPRPIPDRLTMQTLEMIADSHAVGFSLGSVLETGTVEWDSFFTTDHERVFLWCFAVAGMFRLWGVEIDLSTIRDKDYPPTAMRFMMAYSRAHHLIKEIRPDLSNDFHKIAANAQIAVNDAVVAIGGQELQRKDVDPVYEPAGLEHFRRLQKHWAEVIFPKLKDFSYTPFPDQPRPY